MNHNFLKPLQSHSHAVKVRVRFAPSPTGNIHLGGLRTALYNYLFAKSFGGSFVLRIEDTDRARLVVGATEKINDILQWMGLVPDEGPYNDGSFGPYIQSERLHLYHQHVHYLLDNGTAYRCFCTERRLDLLRKDAFRRGQVPKYDNRCRHLSDADVTLNMDHNRPYAIRFKLENCPVNYRDLIFGPVTHNPGNSEGDPIIVKSDGYPTYHFANVVDDHLMKITHVLRGVEWQISTPKHLLLYKAFGWKSPDFAHLPLIVNSDGSKLSKRQGDTYVEFFKDKGYFPEAILNFLIQLGGGFGKCHGPSLRSLQDMVKEFSMERVNVNSCRLELSRLDDYNRIAIQRRLSLDSKEKASLTSLLRQMIVDNFNDKSHDLLLSGLTDAYIERVINTFKGRIACLHHLVSDDYAFLWTEPEKELNQLLNESFPSDVLPEVLKEFSSIPDDSFNQDNVLGALQRCVNKKSIKLSVLMKLVRIALSGRSTGPAVVEMTVILGRRASIKRLNVAQQLLTRISP